jgi:hypothetical protein
VFQKFIALFVVQSSDRENNEVYGFKTILHLD